MDIDLVLNDLKEFLSDDKISTNEPMNKHTSLRIGGMADIYVKPSTIQEIQKIIDVSKKYKIPLNIIGNGSNILVKDNGIRGIVLRPYLTNFEIDKKQDYVVVNAEAGVMNAQIAHKLAEESICGFEFAAGIPGTVGGAVYMNAGAYKKEFKDIVIETTYLDINENTIKTISNQEHNFKYRYSIFMDNDFIILSTKLRFEYGNKDEIIEKLNENMEHRRNTQPLDKPNAGSTFKRGYDFITAKLIDECGLKGKSVGGAMVSTKHAGFIINNGNATASDVIDLINIVKNTVYEQKGKKIELELKIIGD